MWNAIVDGAMPRFWPPRPSRFWGVALEPWRSWYLRRYYGIAEGDVDPSHKWRAEISAGDGVLFAPNHSHDSDPHVMMDPPRVGVIPESFWMANFDGAWKETLDILFEPFMAFFFPEAHRQIDWSRPREMLDKELQKITPVSAEGRRVVDKLVKVHSCID